MNKENKELITILDKNVLSLLNIEKIKLEKENVLSKDFAEVGFIEKEKLQVLYEQIGNILQVELKVDKKYV